MNKNERLSDIIGQCNDEFITKANAEATPIAKRRISFVPFAATAACACLVGGGIFAYSKSVNDKNPQSDVSGDKLYSAESVLEWSSQDAIENADTEMAPEYDLSGERELRARLNELQLYQEELLSEWELCTTELAETEDAEQQAVLQERISEIEEEMGLAHTEILDCENRLQELMQGSTDIAVETPWDDLELCYRYPEVGFNGVTYDAKGAGKHFDVGDMLGAQTISGTNNDTGITYAKSVEFYAIQGIDSGYAIAVKFSADEPYYIYTNCLYDTPTFGDMVEGLNLEENMTFDAAYIESPGTFVEVQDVDLEFMWDFLADCYDAESVGDYLAFSDEVFRENSDALNSLVDFSISSDVLGFENLSFSVTQGGYISTNAISTGRAFYIGADKAKELLSCIKIDDNTVVQVPMFDDDNTSAEDTDAEDEDVLFSMSYSPIDDSQSATLIAEFKETMGEAPLNLTTEQANSILQKISGLTLKDADISEIEFPTGGGIIFEIEGGHRYNFIGENILLFDDAYFSIESDTAELISELTSLLSGASSESNAESDVEITTESNTENESGVSTLVVAAYELNGAYANEVEIPDDAQIYELELVDADASEAPANPNHHSVIEVWHETDESDKISYSFLGDSIVKIGDEYYRDLSGNADILKQAIADNIQNKQDYRHFEVVEFQKYDSESTS